MRNAITSHAVLRHHPSTGLKSMGPKLGTTTAEKLKDEDDRSAAVSGQNLLS